MLGWGRVYKDDLWLAEEDMKNYPEFIEELRRDRGNQESA